MLDKLSKLPPASSIRPRTERAERASGRAIKYDIGPRRSGDPPVLVADVELAKAKLGRTPRFDALDAILEHAWRWEQQFFETSGEV